MKVLKPGKLPPPPPPWPIGQEIICPVCKCRFAAETKADFTIVAQKHPGGRYEARLLCPTCKRPIIKER